MVSEPLSPKHREYLTTAVEVLNLIGETNEAKRISKIILDRALPANLVMEYKMGRNYIRVGDTVKVKPSRPGKRDGFNAVVKRIESDGIMHVMGAPAGKAPAFRAFPIDRIQRKAQSRINTKERF